MTAPAIDASGRRCKVCGELGHRADNVRHTGFKKKVPFAFTPRAAKTPRMRAPGRCNLCGSLDHDRKTCGEEPIVGHVPAAATRARWTPVNNIGAPDDHGGPTDSPAFARARANVHPGANGRIRGRSISPVMKAKERRSLALVVVPDDVPRPRTRGECSQVLRPCPFVSCSQHLYLDVNPQNGTIKLNFPDKEPWQLDETCALDVADAGGVTLERVGQLANITRERCRQIEQRSIEKLQRGMPDVTEADDHAPVTFNRFAVSQEG